MFVINNMKLRSGTRTGRRKRNTTLNTRPVKKPRISAERRLNLLHTVETGASTNIVAAARTLRQSMCSRDLTGRELAFERSAFRTIANAYVKARDAATARALLGLLEAYLSIVKVALFGVQGLMASFPPHHRARFYRVLRMVVDRGISVDAVGLLGAGAPLFTYMMSHPDVRADDVKTMVGLGARLDDRAMRAYLDAHAMLAPDILKVARDAKYRFGKTMWKRLDESTRRVLLRYNLNPVGERWATENERVAHNIHTNPMNYWQYHQDGATKYDAFLSNARRAHFSKNTRLEGYPFVQTPAQSTHTRRLDAAMARYFKHKALRVPAQPSAVDNVFRGPDPARSVRTLWRGMSVTPAFCTRLRHAGMLLDPSYMAFTHNKKIALHYATDTNTSFSVKLVLEIQVDEIPRGTPWVWFGCVRAYGWTTPTNTRYNEAEVLLPPGSLKFGRWITRDGVTYVKSRYTPNDFAVQLPPNAVHPKYRPKPFAGPLMKRSPSPSSPPVNVEHMYLHLFNT